MVLCYVALIIHSGERVWSNTAESARGIYIVCNVPVPYYIECVIETTGSPYTTEYGTLYYFCVFFGYVFTSVYFLLQQYVFSEEIEIFILYRTENEVRFFWRDWNLKDKKTPRNTIPVVE